jgi:hypothetical protein
VGQNAGLGSRTADGVEAADLEVHGALAARVAAHVAGGASRASADSRGDTGVHAGKRGRSSAGVRPVVRLPGVIRGPPALIGAHRPATVRKGHYPLLGRSKDPAVAQWLRVAGLAVHRAFAKGARPAARCEVCPPLFPLTRCAQGGITVVTDRPCVAQGGGRLHSLLGHLRAEGRHLRSDRSGCRRGDLVPAEWARSSPPGPRIHAPHVARNI